jgi:hypothetical protein
LHQLQAAHYNKLKFKQVVDMFRLLGLVATPESLWMFCEMEHLQVGSHCMHVLLMQEILILFPLQLSAIAKEASKLDVKVAPLIVLTEGYDSVPGFIPGQPGAPLVPVVSNHQSAILGVGLALPNVTNTNVALSAAHNGSVVTRSALPTLERVTTPANHLFRPGQKPVSFVSACLHFICTPAHVLPDSDLAVAVHTSFGTLRRARPPNSRMY